MKFWTTLSLSFLSFTWCMAEPQTSGPNTIRIFELDGSPDGRIRNISLSGCTLAIDGSTAVITCTGTGGGGDNFGSHVATQTADFQNLFGITGTTYIAVSSLTVSVTLVSTSGFVAGGSTITSLGFDVGTAGGPNIYSKVGVNSRNTGIYFSGGNINFSASGTQMMVVTSQGLSITANGSESGGSLVFPSGSFFTNGSDLSMAINNKAKLRIDLGTLTDGERNSKVQIGNSYGPSDPRLVATFVASSGTHNQMIAAITSDTVKAQWSGSSATVFTPFNIIDSSASTYPHQYSLTVTTGDGNHTMANAHFPNSFNNISVSTYGYLNAVSSTNIHALTSCGASPTIYGGGNAFTITPGAAAGGCTITFNTAFFKPPVVSIGQRTMSVVNALSYTVTNSQLVITQTGIGVIDVILIGGD